MFEEVRNVRNDFTKFTLLEADIDADPFSQFKKWMQAAFEVDNETANAMILSTVDDTAMPSSRVMLLRGIDNGGFSFFTNYESHKGNQLEQNKNAALCFFWSALQRQVRIQGVIKKLSENESDEYFSSRPFESKVGAWVSKQSKVVKNRAEIDDAFTALLANSTPDIKRPPHWGGFVLIPNKIEFWQGRASRLHDRFLYTLIENNTWKIERLSP
ncbi:MAG: pyridoxamine 5'-phosphate oxidase [Ferruginibacter sp.]|nr:pyridoxamine 5'-phosphate oxidase [Ferruginibacter sp.]